MSTLRERMEVSRLLHQMQKPVVAQIDDWNAARDALTEAQRNRVRASYRALEAGDEPPFPIKGEGPVFEMVSKINTKLGAERGSLGVHVLIDKDGKPISVTTYGAPSKELVQAVSNLFLLQEFKPALCQGKPCQMVYPVYFDFTVAL